MDGSKRIESAAKRTGGFINEFKEFIARGNVVDLAIGVIIGGAFGKIVDSLVNDIIMPPIGVLLGNVNFADFFYTIKPLGARFPNPAAAKAAGAVTINWGVFVNNIIDFLIVAFVIFLMIKQINRMRRQPAPKAPTEKTCPFCATQIPIPAKRCPNCTSDLNQVSSRTASEAA